MPERKETLADIPPTFNERFPTTEMTQYEMREPVYDPSGLDYILSLPLKVPKGLAKLHEGGRRPTTDELIKVLIEGKVGSGMIPSTMLARGLGALLGNKPRPELYQPRRVPTREYI